MTMPLPAPRCGVRVCQLDFKDPVVERKTSSPHDPAQRKNLLLPLWFPHGDHDPMVIAILQEPWIHCLGFAKPVVGLEGEG